MSRPETEREREREPTRIFTISRIYNSFAIITLKGLIYIIHQQLLYHERFPEGASSLTPANTNGCPGQSPPGARRIDPRHRQSTAPYTAEASTTLHPLPTLTPLLAITAGAEQKLIFND